jgi:hypothetical protein
MGVQDFKIFGRIEEFGHTSTPPVCEGGISVAGAAEIPK